MKYQKFLNICLLAAGLALPSFISASGVAFVNAKVCIDESKLGKQEQASFEALRKQMQSVLEQKEKEIVELEKKFDDTNYLETLSNEAEEEMQRKYQGMKDEWMEKQNQFMAALQQAQMKIMQKIADSITKASEQVAKEKKLDTIFNKDTTFYLNEALLDVSKEVIKVMDQHYEEESKNKKQDPMTLDSLKDALHQ